MSVEVHAGQKMSSRDGRDKFHVRQELALDRQMKTKWSILSPRSSGCCVHQLSGMWQGGGRRGRWRRMNTHVYVSSHLQVYLEGLRMFPVSGYTEAPCPKLS